MVKVVTFFLIGMVILALFGKLRLPRARLGRRRGDKTGAAMLDARKCPDCGRHVIGRGPCDCKDNPAKRT